MKDFKGYEICIGSTYYNIHGDIVCRDCLHEWATKKCEKDERGYNKDNCYLLYAEELYPYKYYYRVGYCLFGEFVAYDDLEKWAEKYINVVGEIK